MWLVDRAQIIGLNSLAKHNDEQAGAVVIDASGLFERKRTKPTHAQEVARLSLNPISDRVVPITSVNSQNLAGPKPVDQTTLTPDERYEYMMATAEAASASAPQTAQQLSEQQALDAIATIHGLQPLQDNPIQRAA